MHVNYESNEQLTDEFSGVTPFVDPGNLKFFFEEIHRVSGVVSF